MNEELRQLLVSLLGLLERMEQRAIAEEQVRGAEQAEYEQQQANEAKRAAERQTAHLAQEKERLAGMVKSLELNERDVKAQERIAEALERLADHLESPR